MRTLPTVESGTSELAIFGRLLQEGDGNMTPQLAHYVLTLGFGKNDQDRMTELAERNQDGRLTTQESEELDHFVKAGHLLALLHSKARKSLKQRRSP